MNSMSSGMRMGSVDSDMGMGSMSSGIGVGSSTPGFGMGSMNSGISMGSSTPNIGMSDSPFNFNVNNPHSIFSQPAPQHHPAAPRLSTFSQTLPSLPSDKVLTDSLQRSVNEQMATARGEMDHRNPNWRHPWGIPVEPASPPVRPWVPEALIPRYEHNVNYSDQFFNFPADEEPVFGGFLSDDHNPASIFDYIADENNAVGNIPANELNDLLDASTLNDNNAFDNPPAGNLNAMSNFLVDNNNAFGNLSANNMNDLPVMEDVDPIQANINFPLENMDEFLDKDIAPYFDYNAYYNNVDAAGNAQDGSVGNSGNLAGGANAFGDVQAAGANAIPAYSFGSGLPPMISPNPHGAQPTQAPPVGNALRLIERETQSLVDQGETEEDNEDVRRGRVASATLRSMRTQDVKENKKKAKGKAPANNADAPTVYRPLPEFKDLALGKIKMAKTDGVPGSDGNGISGKGKAKQTEVSDAANGCTFCLHGCDWGVSNDTVLLPEGSSSGWCAACGNPDQGEFFDLWGTIMESRGEPVDREVLKKTDRAEGAADGKKVYSLIDGRDITKFQGPMFCKSCPWRQIDPAKTRICGAHRDEKFAVVKHHRHLQFRGTGYANPEDSFSAQQARRMNMNDVEDMVREDLVKQAWLDAKFKENSRCMVCPSSATEVCVACPLRLCSRCEVLLRNMCKGYLNNLFYYYERDHLRNDAFLLRSDGGGF